MEADILIHNCTILTMNSKQPMIEKGFIAITEGKISKIGRKANMPSAIEATEKIDGTRKIAIPGLINCHTHVSMTLLRGIAEDRPFDEWLKGTIWPLEAKLTARHIQDGALLGCLEMMKSGTTCFADMYFHEDAVAKAVEQVGLRAVLSEAIIEAGDNIRGKKMLRNSIKTTKEYNGYADGRVNVRLGPHALYSCSPNLLRQVREAASNLKVGLHIHLAESKQQQMLLERKHGLSETQLLERIGILDDPNVLAAHCIHLSEQDLHILAEHDVKVAYNPVANMKLGMGSPRISDLLKLGVTVGLGTDGPASNNSLDMFETMKVAALLQKAIYGDPTVLPVENVVRMATIEGAKALGSEQVIGSLEIGKQADLILLDFNKPHLTPHHDLYAGIVYSARGGDVDTVIVDGRVLMKCREVKTVNEEKVMERAQRTAENLAAH